MMAPCYACGEPIRLGDIVGVGYSMFGKIVYLIGRGERCEDIPVDDWRHLDGGYVIQTPEGRRLCQRDNWRRCGTPVWTPALRRGQWCPWGWR